MSRHTAAIILVGSIPLAFVVGSVSPIGELGLLFELAVFVWVARNVTGFAGGAFRGAIAGAVAGVLVLGVGLRLAMRVVAISDPIRTPEFSVGGTAFILVGVGLMLGTFAGAYLGGLRHLLGLTRRSVILIGTVALVLMLFGDSETRSELFDLGLGGWVNIPMFGAIVVAYCWTQDVIVRGLDRRASRGLGVSDDAEPASVP
jgi:hypothetical protein